VSSRERLDLNLSVAFAEFVLTTSRIWNSEGQRILMTARGSYAPYRIKNRTGSTLSVWTDNTDRGDGAESAQIILHNQSVDWRFDDWRSMREVTQFFDIVLYVGKYSCNRQHIGASEQHAIGIHLVGKPWERLRAIPVDREGEYIFSLKPRTEQYTTRLLCEVKVVENVKEIVFRSTYRIENQTFYPLELTLVDDGGQPVYSLEKIYPGQDYSLPLESVFQTRIRIQPDRES
jgi:vacuolar protein sorting-associated protein 13A/C